ncbi:11167_t:CDS:2 [Funneliformis mosseae]|uniref:11167_t:CDS:1 n=1 Tax=Funneliformis mosseae TaxID=27381 RepID=A0A9N9AUU2_FUNMO|nr:11167_t:CDS:2 [Funneliformis mosseae]
MQRLENEHREINHYKKLAQQSENEVKFENEVNATKRQIQKLNQYNYYMSRAITNYKNYNRLLIQAVLQRHVIEIIFANATQYFHVSGRQQLEHLESQISNKEIELNRGFEDTSRENNTVYEHAFITQCKQQLNDIMNGLRTINDKQKKSDSEKYAVTIIREVVKIFYFRLKVQEPVVQHNWSSDDKNLYVDLCYFPLIGKDLMSEDRKVYTLAKVVIRKAQVEVQKPIAENSYGSMYAL